jgi:glycine dehydrogenase
MNLDPTDRFENRHIGPDPRERDEMLAEVGAASLAALLDETVPADIRLSAPLRLPRAETEFELLQGLRAVAARNQLFKSYIGMGFYDSITPSVILRNVFENPSWYTPYTPYQAEIAQGRLEASLNFQTMVCDLTAMPVATASLLDEATAAAEAMAMLYRIQNRTGSTRKTLLAAGSCFPQTLDVVAGRAESLGIRIRRAGTSGDDLDEDTFGALVQCPDGDGAVTDLRALIERAHARGVLVAVATDLLSLTLLTPPGEWGADVVVGSAQRFGVPMGYGGPHAAFLATRAEYVRNAPGRIIGVSTDARGNTAYRMALQTREQHIRREKATSNICTAQALLANMAGMYAVYHGPEGLTGIGARVHALAQRLEEALKTLGYVQLNPEYFDTLRIRAPERSSTDRIRELAERARMNFRYVDSAHFGIALDETTTAADVEAIVAVCAEAVGRPAPGSDSDARAADDSAYPPALARRSPFLTHPVFSRHRSETEMMRYIKSLELKDLGLDRAMIPLGSCTMKLNPATAMIPVTWPEFSRMHPFAPVDQAAGYAQVIRELEAALAEITGLPAVSLQPNSGAQGEFTGLMVIRAYLAARHESARNVVLIPASAHGTNPASAVMAGFTAVVVATDREGNVDLGDLQSKVETYRDRLAALMITYPSTHGVFEDRIRAICSIVHESGGQVYMDGANMNAQVGVTSPAAIGADVCHLNLHKTFAIPHGGGGPGMGPIAAAAHLGPFLPGHAVVHVGGPEAIHAVSAAPWGSASILLISYAYIRMLGAAGLTAATACAILNANYVKCRLERYYRPLYTRPNGRVAHELILDLRDFKSAGVDEIDVAKRLMDYGFHAPTVSFPVAGTLMIEPTESESKAELDRFCDALIGIREEIQAVVDGTADAGDNVLKNAPHTVQAVTADDWSHPYSRAQAAFPLPFVKTNKFWPSVGRIDGAYGDRHLMCVCPPVEEERTGPE